MSTAVNSNGVVFAWKDRTLEFMGEIAENAVAAFHDKEVSLFAEGYAANTPYWRENLRWGLTQLGAEERIIEAYSNVFIWDGVHLVTSRDVWDAAVAAVDSKRVVEFVAAYASVTPFWNENLRLGFGYMNVRKEVWDAYFRH